MRSRESGDRRSRSPRRTFDLREKLLLKEEGQKRELAEIKRQMKVIQPATKTTSTTSSSACRVEGTSSR